MPPRNDTLRAGAGTPDRKSVPQHTGRVASLAQAGYRLEENHQPGGFLHTARWALLLALLFSSVPWAAATTELPPNLARSPDRGPIFLMGSAAVGGTPGYDTFNPGFGVSILFRPQAAANFLSFLYRWNTGMIMQVEYRPVAADRRLLAADLIFRRYLANMKDETIGTSYFVGLGIGAAEATYPVGTRSSSEIWWTYLVEFGSERSPSDHWTFVLKGQWRIYDHHTRNYSSWSVHFGIGIPLPW